MILDFDESFRTMWYTSRDQKLCYSIKQGRVVKKKKTVRLNSESFYEGCAMTFVFKLSSNGIFQYEGQVNYDFYTRKLNSPICN